MLVQASVPGHQGLPVSEDLAQARLRVTRVQQALTALSVSHRARPMHLAQLACVSVSVLNNAATLRLGLMLDDMRVLVLGALSQAGAASAEVLAS